MRIFIFDWAASLLVQRKDIIISVNDKTPLKIIGLRNQYNSSLHKAKCDFLQPSDDGKQFEYKKDFLIVEKNGEMVAIKLTGNKHNDQEIIKAINI